MAVVKESQSDWVDDQQTRDEFIAFALGENIMFKHGRSQLYYSPRLQEPDLIAGVIEKKVTETIKDGPWENTLKTVDTFNTVNFAIKLKGRQDVAIEASNTVYSGDALLLFESLAQAIREKTRNWRIEFRQVGSERDLTEYLKRHSGSIKKITILFKMPNADFSPFEKLHDDIKKSLERIDADSLKKEISSSKASIKPDDKLTLEMHYANEGGVGEVLIQKADDMNTPSFNSKDNGFSAVVDDNRKIDQAKSDSEKREIANNMLEKAKDNDE